MCSRKVCGDFPYSQHHNIYIYFLNYKQIKLYKQIKFNKFSRLYFKAENFFKWFFINYKLVSLNVYLPFL